MVKVPSFYTRKFTEPQLVAKVQPKKPPVVVIRTGKPLSEIIRPEKEITETLLQENNLPNF